MTCKHALHRTQARTREPPQTNTGTMLSTSYKRVRLAQYAAGRRTTRRYQNSPGTHRTNSPDELTGNKNFIWAAGATAALACAMTAIDAVVLARTMRTGAARAKAGDQSPSPTMTSSHNSNCRTEPVTYPSAQQNNGTPAGPAVGVNELRVNVDPVSGPTSCSPTETPGQQAGSQPTGNPFMTSTR